MDPKRVRLVDGRAFRKMLKAVGSEGVRSSHVAVAKALAQQIDAKAIDTDNRIIPFTISTASVDREGDTIALEGWKLDNYLKNPVVLFGHDHYQPPVAQALTVFAENAKLKSRAQFMPREMSEFAYSVFQMYAGGYMRATSVGFIPEEWDYANDDNGERRGLNFTSHEMIEYSCVPVPANPEALVEARAKGINTRPFRDWSSRVLDEAKHPRSASRGLLERIHELSDDTGRRIFTSLSEIRLPAEDGVVVVDRAAFLGKSDETHADLLAIDEDHPQPVEREDDEDLVVEDAPPPCADPPPAADPAPATDQVLEADDEQGFRAGGEQVAKAPGGFVAEVHALLHEEADPLRWNRRFSKAFDIDRQQLQPATAELALAAGYVDCDVKHLAKYREVLYPSRMGAWLTSLDEALVEATIDDTRNLDYHDEKEQPPVYEVIQLNSRRSSEFMVDGIRFMRWRGAKLMVRLEPNWYGTDVKVYGQRGNGSEQAVQLLAEVAERADTYKFLRGEAFTLSGEFLQRGDTRLDDVFLDAKNAKAIERAMHLLNTKGADMDPRGMMLLGPPGTGKTLSGRVMRDQVQATFIHVAARDLARMGAFGGLLHAMSLARENRPAHVFIEDVDNWLDDYTVDMLKTEMDGLTQHKGVVVTLTTNYPERMPKALIDRPGRFHDVCRFGNPDAHQRMRMVQRWMPELTPQQQAKAVEETNGYSGAHVRELARFVEIIREQDEVELGVALDAAIAKMKEQRDLITSSQTHGSRYRAPVAMGRRAAAPATGGVVEKATPGGTLKALEELAGKFDAARVGDVVQVHVDAETIAKVGRLVSVAKQGRVLSAKNERALTEGLDAIYTAVDKFKGILAQVQQDPMPDDEAAGDKGKAVPPAGDDVVEAEHVLLLDEEEDLGDIDADEVRAAATEVSRETVMMLTGRVL